MSPNDGMFEGGPNDDKPQYGPDDFIEPCSDYDQDMESHIAASRYQDWLFRNG